MRCDPRMATRFESHLTVLHDVPNIAELRRIAAGTPPLRLRATRATRWEEPEPGIYLGVDDPDGTRRKADEAWSVLRSLVCDADFEVEELVLHEQETEVWRGAGRVGFGAPVA